MLNYRVGLVVFTAAEREDVGNDLPGNEDRPRHARQLSGEPEDGFLPAARTPPEMGYEVALNVA